MKRLKIQQQAAAERASRLASEADPQDPAEQLATLRLIAVLAEKVLPEEVTNGQVIPTDLSDDEAVCYWVWRLSLAVADNDPAMLTEALKTICEASWGTR